ncbi:MAG: SfiI family type II restriction endonuclease [Kiritimatiellae bacterium]|nr:SfiI family type II restriction endonuclease [Kiritimatiellia bacterium]
MTEKDPNTLTSGEIERIEKLTLRWIFQAVVDFGIESHEIFYNSPDCVQAIAEDITRELLDRLPGFNVPDIFGCKAKARLTGHK